MTELPVPRRVIISRLNKIEGQVRGTAKMVADERNCTDVLVQLSASRAALESVAALVLRNYASICAVSGDTTDIGAELAKAVAIWVGGRTRA